MKKLFIFKVVLLVILVLVLQGCQTVQNDPVQQTATAAAQTSNPTQAPGATENPKGDFAAEANTFPISAEPITMSVLALSARAEVEDWDDNGITKYWEEKTGLDIAWDIITDSTASRQKLTVVMSSGDLPDIIMGGSISLSQAYVYGSQGLLIPLNDMIDLYGVNLKILFEYDPEVQNIITAPDKNIYCLPQYYSKAKSHMSCTQKCYLNTAWIDNLDLSIPSTTDEFYEVLKAFRDNDANGNGDASDEIPLAAASTDVDTFIMNSFQYNSGSGNNRLMVEDDVVKACYVQDGWQEGLKYYRMLYAEDLLDKEIFIADRNQLKLYTGDENGNRMGACLYFVFSSVMDTTTDVVEEYSFIEPLTGPTGLKQTVYSARGLSAQFFITSSCQNPEAAFRWGDAMMKNPFEGGVASLEGIYGPEGEGWEKPEQGVTGLDGKTQALYKWLFTYGETTKTHWYEYGCWFLPAEYKISMAVDTSGWNQEKVLYEATIDLYQPYAQDRAIPMLIFEEDVSTEAAQLVETINTYVSESISKFVTGTWDIDDYWDDYLSELKGMGFDRLLELYQNAYEMQYVN